MTSRYHVIIGIERPEGIDPQAEYLRPVVEMRKDINRAYRDSNLIRQCRHRADREGLNGEDHMTLLAYCALRMLEDANQRELAAMEHAGIEP